MKRQANTFVPLLRKFTLTGGGFKKAFYLHDGITHGFFQQRLCEIPLSTAGASTTLSTDGTKKVPTEIVAGSVVYVKNLAASGLLVNGLPSTLPGKFIKTRWEERTVLSLPTAFSISVDSPINILAPSNGFAYRVLFSGAGPDDGWIGSGQARDRILNVDVQSGGQVDVEVWQRDGDSQDVLLDTFSVVDSIQKVYDGSSDYTRVMMRAPGVDSNVSASLLIRRL